MCSEIDNMHAWKRTYSLGILTEDGVSDCATGGACGVGKEGGAASCKNERLGWVV